MERFDIFAAKGGIDVPSEPTAVTPATTNGHKKDPDSMTPADPSSPAQSSVSQKRQADSEDRSDLSSKTPPAKKPKPDHDVDADALYAAKLQAEENMRARPTRGASTRKAQPAVKKKKTTKAKTSKKVKAEDDSDLDSGSEENKKVNRSGGFHVWANSSCGTLACC
jgi:upstream activation factor subunit UAF30